MFCRCSAWSHTVLYEKEEWLHRWVQIGIRAQCCCINAELVIRKLHSFRLLQNFLSSCDIIENLNISLNCNQSGILQQRTRDEELKKHCVTLLENFGSLSFTRRTLEELDIEARTEVAKHGGNPMLEDILDKLLEWKRWPDEKKPGQ